MIAPRYQLQRFALERSASYSALWLPLSAEMLGASTLSLAPSESPADSGPTDFRSAPPAAHLAAWSLRRQAPAAR